MMDNIMFNILIQDVSEVEGESKGDWNIFEKVMTEKHPIPEEEIDIDE